MKCPYLQPKKRRIRHHVEYLDSVATATGVLNTIPKPLATTMQRRVADLDDQYFLCTSLQWSILE